MKRFRYLGTFAHRLMIANVVAVDVRHGTVFEVPAKWAYVLPQRGTPVEEVGDDVPLGDVVADPEPVQSDGAEAVSVTLIHAAIAAAATHADINAVFRDHEALLATFSREQLEETYVAARKRDREQREAAEAAKKAASDAESDTDEDETDDGGSDAPSGDAEKPKRSRKKKDAS